MRKDSWGEVTKDQRINNHIQIKERIAEYMQNEYEIKGNHFKD